MVNFINEYVAKVRNAISIIQIWILPFLYCFYLDGGKSVINSVGLTLLFLLTEPCRDRLRFQTV